jgi:hypothetical protein
MDPSDLSTAISGLGGLGAAFYNAVTFNTPVVTSASQAVANQLAVNQAAQLNLSQSNPTLAGILANPGFLVLMGLAIVGLIVWLIYK